jgi:hypothetical protein
MQYLREREIESRGSDFVAQIRANVLALTSHGSPVKQLRRSAKQGVDRGAGALPSTLSKEPVKLPSSISAVGFLIMPHGAAQVAAPEAF